MKKQGVKIRLIFAYSRRPSTRSALVRFRGWLDRGANSPNEQVAKSRLKEVTEKVVKGPLRIRSQPKILTCRFGDDPGSGDRMLSLG